MWAKKSLARHRPSLDAGDMFHVFCEGHGRDVLLSERDVRLHNIDPGILVAWRCPCGTEGSFLTGRKAEAAAA
jgi:hypothetical protein